ncbi:MAG: hypothetical protein GXO18_05280 [Aquificae bacterium]|nr:hypothetical protein [Aquificota bacterium]
MDKEAVKERIKFYTELLKLLWVLLIALGGGLSSLFLRGVEGFKELLLILVGFILFVLVLLGIVIVVKSIQKLLKSMEEIND